MTLCSARGARDTAVAEWVLAAILAMELLKLLSIAYPGPVGNGKPADRADP